MPWKAETHWQKERKNCPRAERVRDDAFYADRRWRKVRAMKLRRDPLCSDPFGFHDQDGVLVPAKDVHHVKDRRTYPDLRFRLDNLESLCHACHSMVTRQEGAGLRHG